MKKDKKILLGAVIALAVILSVAAIAALKIIEPVVTFDFASQSELTGRASGFLYGFAEDDIPCEGIAESIAVNCLATKPAGGLQHPIGDVRNVSDTFLSAGGEMLMVYTQDMYDTWYYQLDSLPEYNERVRATVTEMASSDYASSLVYCIYNEMDNGAWLGNFREEENRYKFYEAWKETYNIVKEIDPGAKLAGPGHCGYNYDFIKEFLSYCKEESCLPEVVVWHELSDQSIYRMEHNFNGYYSICDELGIERLPVCISEYGLMRTNGIPGESVKWIARLEKQDAYGCVAYWRLADNLSDTVADDVTPNSNYWVYNFYGKMKGKELSASERDILNSNVGKWLKKEAPLMNKGFVALASYDDSEKKIYVLASGSDMDGRIKINNIDESAFADGDRIKIEIKSVDFRGLGGEVLAPVKERVINTTIRNHSVSFTLPTDNNEQAFFVEITKEEAESYENKSEKTHIEAEDCDLSGGAFADVNCAYSISGSIVRDLKAGSVMSFNYKAPSEGEYEISFVYANGADSSQKVSVLVNGRMYECLFSPTLKYDCTEAVEFRIACDKGDNEITVSADSEESVCIDFIEISPCRDKEIFFERLTSRNVPEGENAFYTVIPEDGFYKLSGLTDNSAVMINKIPLTDDDDGIFFFSRGYNKIVLPEGAFFEGVEKAENYGELIVFTPDDVTYSGDAKAEYDENTSTGKHMGWISSESGGGVSFSVDVPEEGYYSFTFEYANNEKGGYHDYNVDLIERYICAFVNGENRGRFFFRSTYSWDLYKTRTIVLQLCEGENEITFLNDGSYSFNDQVTYAPDIGSITVAKTS